MVLPCFRCTSNRATEQPATSHGSGSRVSPYSVRKVMRNPTAARKLIKLFRENSEQAAVSPLGVAIRRSQLKARDRGVGDFCCIASLASFLSCVFFARILPLYHLAFVLTASCSHLLACIFPLLHHMPSPRACLPLRLRIPPGPSKQHIIAFLNIYHF